MEIDINSIDDIINRFMSGEMSEDEKSDFLTRLETDDKLRQRAQLVGLIAREIHHVNSEETIIDALSKTDKDDFRKKLQRIKEEKRESNVSACSIDDGICIKKDENNNRNMRWRILSIAASILIVLGVFTVYQHFNRADYTSLGAKQVVVTTFRSAGDSQIISNLSDISNKIIAGDSIDDAISQLSDYYWNDKNEDLKPFHDDIGWNLAVAYLKVNDKENAMLVLNNIIKESKSQEHIEKAKELLNDINDI